MATPDATIGHCLSRSHKHDHQFVVWKLDGELIDFVFDTPARFRVFLQTVGGNAQEALPIWTTATSGNKVVITAICPTSEHCIVGQYWLKGDGPYEASWNLCGVMDSRLSGLVLDMKSSDDLASLVLTLEKLRARSQAV